MTRPFLFNVEEEPQLDQSRMIDIAHEIATVNNYLAQIFIWHENGKIDFPFNESHILRMQGAYNKLSVLTEINPSDQINEQFKDVIDGIRNARMDNKAILHDDYTDLSDNIKLLATNIYVHSMNQVSIKLLTQYCNKPRDIKDIIHDELLGTISGCIRALQKNQFIKSEADSIPTVLFHFPKLLDLLVIQIDPSIRLSSTKKEIIEEIDKTRKRLLEN